MERLTSHCGAINNHKTAYPKSNFTTGDLFQIILNKLSDYEDTNLTPEEIEAIKAENHKYRDIVDTLREKRRQLVSERDRAYLIGYEDAQAKNPPDYKKLEDVL